MYLIVDVSLLLILTWINCVADSDMNLLCCWFWHELLCIFSVCPSTTSSRQCLTPAHENISCAQRFVRYQRHILNSNLDSFARNVYGPFIKKAYVKVSNFFQLSWAKLKLNKINGPLPIIIFSCKHIRTWSQPDRCTYYLCSVFTGILYCWIYCFTVCECLWNCTCEERSRLDRNCAKTHPGVPVPDRPV